MGEEEVVGMTISAIISDLGSISTGLIGVASDVVEFIGDNPLVLITALVPLVGYGIHYFKMVFRP